MLSPEWKGIAVAVAVAFLSISLLAVDAFVDLSASGFTKRLAHAEASIVDAMGQHQLAFAVRTWARGKDLPQHQCPRSTC